MKLATSIFVLTLAATTAMGQSVMAPINAAKRAANASSSRTAETNRALNAPQAAAPAAKAGQPSATAAKSPKPSATAKAMPGGKTVATANSAANDATTAKATPAAPELKVKNHRDPFVSIIRTDTSGGKNPCESGKKCLVAGEIVLRGIIKSPDTIIAVVENSHRKTYFLHENDPVFNGEVVKITSDSIVFREHMTDRAGHAATREITKQLNARPIA